MAEVDASIYGQLRHPDPLGTAQKVQDYDTSVQQNKLVTMEAQGKQRLGQAVQEATGPDGQVDQVKLSEILKRPENYSAAAAGAQLGLGLQQGQIANTKAGIDVSQTGFENLGAAWGARAAQGGPISPDDLREDVITAIQAGRIDPKQGIKWMRMIPSDPAAARAFAAGGFVQALGPAGMAAPAEATPGPGGETRKQTTGQFVTQSLGATPAGEEPPAPGIRTSPTLAESVALPAVAVNAAQQANRLSTLAAEVPVRKANLDNMLADAEQFTAGPASEELKTTIAGINEIFGTNFEVERVAAQERFDKLANQIALQQAGDLGITDQRVATAMGANPHSKLSNLGIQGVIALLKGNEDALSKKDEAWHDFLDAGHTPDQYYTFSQDFNRHYDPRIFQAVYLPKLERGKMVAAMNPREREEFKRKYLYALEHGWIPDLSEQE